MAGGFVPYGNAQDYLNQSGSPFDIAGFDPFSILGDLGSFGLGIPGLGMLGGLLGDLLGGLFTGVPTPAKTLGAGETLRASGNPELSMLGSFLDKYGGGSDNVLSNPTFAHEANSVADVLTWLEGGALPGWKPMGSTGELANIPPPPGAPYSKGVNIMGIQSPEQMEAILGQFPNLNPFEIESIMPAIETQIAQNPNAPLSSLKSFIANQVTNARNNPGGMFNSGGGGNLFNGGGGELSSILELLPLMMMMGGGMGNFLNPASFGGGFGGNGFMLGMF